MLAYILGAKQNECCIFPTPCQTLWIHRFEIRKREWRLSLEREKLSKINTCAYGCAGCWLGSRTRPKCSLKGRMSLGLTSVLGSSGVALRTQPALLMHLMTYKRDRNHPATAGCQYMHWTTVTKQGHYLDLYNFSKLQNRSVFSVKHIVTYIFYCEKNPTNLWKDCAAQTFSCVAV